MGKELSYEEKVDFLEDPELVEDPAFVLPTNHLLEKIQGISPSYTDKLYAENFSEVNRLLEETVVEGDICRHWNKRKKEQQLDFRYGPISMPFDVKENHGRYSLVLITGVKCPSWEEEKLMESPFNDANISYSPKQLKMFL